MTRKSARIKWQQGVKAGVEEKKEDTSTNLLSLTPEMVAMVASYLDVSSYLALASSSTALIGILVSERKWKTLLQRTRMNAKRLITQFEYLGGYIDYLDLVNTEKRDMEMEVKELADFLKFVNDPEGKRLLALLDIICERFPGDFRPKFEAVLSLPHILCSSCNAFWFQFVGSSRDHSRGCSFSTPTEVASTENFL